MIDEILRNNLIIREWVNGGLLPLNISLVLVIGLFLWEAWRDSRHAEVAVAQSRWPMTWRFDFAGTFARTYVRWHTTSGVSTACALIWIFAADAIRAGSAWYVLSQAVTKIQPTVSSVENAWISIGFLIAGIVGLLASIRCIYLFTPPWLGHWYWIGSILVTFAFQIIT